MKTYEKMEVFLLEEGSMFQVEMGARKLGEMKLNPA